MLIETIEQLAANAWPAPVQQMLERWRLRAGDGVTRRANSVLAVGPAPVYEGWMDEVARFYGARGLPMRFHVSDGSPAGLEKMLDGMGYVAEAHTHSAVEIASCRAVLERAAGAARPAQLEMRTFDGVDGTWLGSFMEIEGIAASKKGGYARILSGIGPPACFVEALVDGQIAGVGMAVAERGWAGLFSIATAASHRGQGIGTQVVRELAAWSDRHGAESLYLQVMEENQPAVKLYKKLGFARIYGYHYRILVQKIEGGN